MTATTAYPPLDIYPWQHGPWKQLQQAIEFGRLPHAVLLNGPEGTGKSHFAQVFLRSLFCIDPRPWGVCGQCRSCRWFAQGHHPDCMTIEPEAEGKAIGIDRIRGLGEFLQLKSHGGGIKAALISPAERMPTAAANSLLKTLEEPPGSVCLVLITSQMGRLLPTVRSRCQWFHFPPVSFDDAHEWLHKQTQAHSQVIFQCLSLAQGAPMTAMRWLQDDPELAGRNTILEQMLALIKGGVDPVDVAGQWLKAGLQQPLYWLNTAMMDMLRLHHTANPPYLSHPDWGKRLKPVAADKSARQLLRALESIVEARRLLSTSANQQLLAEKVALEMAQVGKL